MWAASDEALLAGLGAGDAEAIAAFVRRFQRRVFGLAMAITSDQGVAEDVAQEAFARAWRHAQAYDARRGPVAAWLLAITRNLAIDAMRLRRAEPTDPDALLAMGIPATDAGPDERAIAGEDIARLRRAIIDLPEDQRRALVLAAFYGRTAREISDSEHVPLGTAKTRIRAAMIKLRSAFEVKSERSDLR